MAFSKVGPVLIIVGLLCLPAPVYIGAVVDATTSEETTTVYEATVIGDTEPPSDSETAGNGTREPVAYENLSADERDRVDRIIQSSVNASGSDTGCSLPDDRSALERVPMVLERNGTLYEIEHSDEVESRLPGVANYGLLVTFVGFVAVLAGIVKTLEEAIESGRRG
ncbi:hypothetical protein [Halapricum desulfuricans]|uniref:DUF7979 domain-containing protein n=1 Tax=Halapricum desulfuricans TaxID=2841257 RepID=A0A897NT88_9EURY|nr:hypothetical protein [Halapricum desulfuricans]QSG15654.1 hypothetical protein HSEST_2139 [Halapricum desulfuricans]